MAERLRSFPPVATYCRLRVGLRSGREFDPCGPETHVAAVRRIPDPAEGRSAQGPRVRLRREGRHATPVALSTRPAASGWVLAGRSTAQERMLCRLRCCEGL